MKIFVVPIPKQGPNGDRATTMQLYYDYEIHVCKHGEVADHTCVDTIIGYDNWHSMLKNPIEVKKEAKRKAKKLAEAILGDATKWQFLEETPIFRVTCDSVFRSNSLEDVLDTLIKNPEKYLRITKL